MRSYSQFCAVARGLDVVGDRWTLLIVRELLIRGQARYSDLRAGLPGIATNLLADRLRELQHHGVVAAVAAPPPVATTLFSLTERGRELQPVLLAIGRWGGALLREASHDAFQSHWLVLPLRLELTDRRPEAPPVTLLIDTGDEPLTVRAGGGAVTVATGAPAEPDATLAGPPSLVVALLLGDRPLEELRAAGLAFTGDADVLGRIRTAGDAAPG